VSDQLFAGEFSTWLAGVEAAIVEGSATDVPCGSCTACCRSAQFVHVAPDEAAALAHIPSELLFPAPMMPRGHMLMGYDQDGRCPMLGSDGCTIYAHRPRTCRTYDCRVFTATDVEPDADKPAIIERTRRWRFDHNASTSRELHDAVRAAARFVEQHRDEFGIGRSNTDVAVAAVTAHRLFAGAELPDVERVRVAVRGR
jgi:Fe-S-cluster containining protein